jgi:hypothetical protein
LKKRTTFVRDGVTVVMEDGLLDAELPIGDGIARWFHENGKLKAEVLKIDGNSHGVSRSWHDNGALAQEKTYIHGKLQGIVRVWNKDGSPDCEMDYITPNAIFCRSCDDLGKWRSVFLWNGKPISKSKWMQKVEAAGISKSELERKLAATSAAE